METYLPTVAEAWLRIVGEPRPAKRTRPWRRSSVATPSSRLGGAAFNIAVAMFICSVLGIQRARRSFSGVAFGWRDPRVAVAADGVVLIAAAMVAEVQGHVQDGRLTGDWWDRLLVRLI